MDSVLLNGREPIWVEIVIVPVLLEVGRLAEMGHYYTLRQSDGQQSIIYLNLVGVLGREDLFEKLKCACLKVHPRKNNMEPENVP